MVATNPATTGTVDLDAIFKNTPKLTPKERALVQAAFDLATQAHAGQKRANGDPYIGHPLAVTLILSEYRLDAPTLAAALLHDVVEDTPITLKDIEAEFGLEVARLVDGVTKLEKLPHDTDGMKSGKAGNREAETLRKIFLAMSNDIRVVLIKLADRLHNMRTLGFLKPEKQTRMARETMEIFAPLANRLGIWQMKWELEDLSFRYLNPAKYKEIATQLAQRRVDRERYLTRVKEKLSQALAAEGIQCTLSARPKHIYSIHRKMERKKVSFGKVYDVHAMRVIVADVKTCYQTLGVVHGIWHPIPGEFDDYIAAPKENFYQSLHTAIIDEEGGYTLEVQIRTPEMHEHAEYGVAAHWRYKEGSARDEAFENRLRYLRRLMDFDDDETNENADEYVKAMKSDVFQNRVYVFSPKGDAFDLPAGATPIDFAYHVHTEVGNRCRGARVNGLHVGLDYHLKSGDRVEIITFKRGGPSLDWLNPNLGYVHTNRARAKIRAWFKRQGRDKNIAEGRSLVSRELKRLGHDAMPIEQLAGLFNLTNVDDFLANVGFGDITAAQVASKILEFERRQIRENPPDELKPTAPTRKYPVNASDGINIMGDSGSGILYTLARCCNPIHGEPIIGYVTRGKGMTVHRIDCPNVANITDTERLRPANWGSSAERTYPVPVVIMAIDREGLMRDVGAMVANESINMTDVSIVNRNGMATFNVTMEMADLAQLARVLSKVEQIPNVISARRVMG